MNMTTPTPGQPLSEADVSLLQPGDWLLVSRPDGFLRNRGFVEGSPVRLRSAEDGWIDLADMPYAQGSSPARFTFLGRPDQDGWIAWSGGENPVPGVTVEVRLRSGDEFTGSDVNAEGTWRHIWGEGDIIAYRPHAPVSRPGDGVEGVGEWTDLKREIDAKILSESHDKARVIYGPLSHDYLIQELAIRDALLRRAAALTPPAEPVSRPDGEGEREAVDLWYPVKNAIARAMLDERDGKPCGCIIEAGCEARGYHDPAYAADGFMVSATDAIISLLSPAAPDAGGGDDQRQEAIDDVISHASDWRTAFIAMDAAEETPEDGSGKPGYWLHQIKVLDRIVSALQPGGER